MPEVQQILMLMGPPKAVEEALRAGTRERPEVVAVISDAPNRKLGITMQQTVEMLLRAIRFQLECRQAEKRARKEAKAA